MTFPAFSAAPRSFTLSAAVPKPSTSSSRVSKPTAPWHQCTSLGGQQLSDTCIAFWMPLCQCECYHTQCLP